MSSEVVWIYGARRGPFRPRILSLEAKERPMPVFQTVASMRIRPVTFVLCRFDEALSDSSSQTACAWEIRTRIKVLSRQAARNFIWQEGLDDIELAWGFKNRWWVSSFFRNSKWIKFIVPVLWSSISFFIILFNFVNDELTLWNWFWSLHDLF